MSIKRLNADEKATYLIGIAVRRQLDEAPRDPETLKEIRAVYRWLEHWLTPGEVSDTIIATGHLIDPDFAEELLALQGPSRPVLRPKPDEPDDIPF
ncbi:MAG: hypothetical protein WBE80_17190 [Methylocella sp.]